MGSSWIRSLRILLLAAAATYVAGPVAIRLFAAAQQQRPSQGGVVSGQVLDGMTGAPVAGASVSLENPGRGSQPLRARPTDADGRFTILDVPTGAYTVTSQASGYATGSAGSLRPTDLLTTVRVGTGAAQDVRIRMWRSGTVTGVVRDENHRPIAGAQIELRRRDAKGYGGQFGIPHNAVTDASGVYSIAGLPPADYLVGVLFTPTTIPVSVLDEYHAALSARSEQGQALLAQLLATRLPLPSRPGLRLGAHTIDVVGPTGPAPQPGLVNGRLRGYQTTFFPTAATVYDARPIRVSVGEVRGGTDFELTAKPTVRVSGVVTGPDGPAAFVGLRLVAPDEPRAEENEYIQLTMFENALTVTDEHGAFTFLGVPPGHFALKTAPAGHTPWVSADVIVGDTDITDLAVTLRPGLRVRGHAEFDGGAPPVADFPRAAVAQLGTLLDAVPGPPGVALDASGAFVSAAYPPGRYLVLSRTIGAWRLRSAMLDGRDVSLMPLDLVDKDVDGLVLSYTLATNPILAGTVEAQRGVSAAATEVIVFPAAYDSWLRAGLPSHLPRRDSRVTHVNEAGAFNIPLLAAGDYFVGAVKGEDAGDLSADFFRRLAAVATPISLRDGQVATVSLTPVAVR